MPKLDFTREEIEELAQKLDSLQSQLSDRDRLLLLAIFAAASNQVWNKEEKGLGATEPTLADLRKELLNAFLPGNDHKFYIHVPIITPPKGH